ncbi:MAG: hypothetical protein ACKO6K_03395, partial [Chitinophagaceae bacterium]
LHAVRIYVAGRSRYLVLTVPAVTENDAVLIRPPGQGIRLLAPEYRPCKELLFAGELGQLHGRSCW